MERQLPIHDIGGTKFYVDVERDEFREVLNPGNRIPFEELLFKGDHYELAFDRSTRSVFRGDLDSAVGRQYVSFVKIPRLYELDPEGMEHKLANWKSRHATMQDAPTTSKRMR